MLEAGLIDESCMMLFKHFDFLHQTHISIKSQQILFPTKAHFCCSALEPDMLILN